METDLMTVRVANNFHGTECRLRIRRPVGGCFSILSDSQVKRCRKELCGIDGCTCGGALSERGPQECTIYETGSSVCIRPNWLDSYESTEEVFDEPAIVTRRLSDNHAIGYRRPN